MPDAPNPRAARPRKRNSPVAAAATAGEHQPRGARRKQETRARLLDAALRLMADKGMESVAISEITEAADVGFGSFYNHFESKEGIFSALVEWAFGEFAETIDRLASGLSDPAEVVAVSVRHVLLRARREPVWGKLLVREGFTARLLDSGLGQRFLRDSARGIAAKRFIVADPLMTLLTVTGTVLAGIATELHRTASAAMTGRAPMDGADAEDGLAERAATVVLQLLGLKRQEAESIAVRPLPGGVLEAKR